MTKTQIENINYLKIGNYELEFICLLIIEFCYLNSKQN